ncbi:MAG: prolipoprotein diacylglyceryl transferase [Chloroflexota bacterium]
MLPYINLGSIGFPTAPLVYIIGAWVSLYVVDRAARRLELDAETIYSLAAATLISGFVGARLTFVLLHWSSFDDNLLGILWPLNSGYSGVGGVLFAAAATYFYARWKRLDLWTVLDALAPGIISWLIFTSLADFLGGPGFGALTSLPWGIEQYGVQRHPVQIYEILVGLASLGVWWLATQPERRSLDGRAFLMTTAVYAGGRLFVEAFRDNAWYTTNGLHVVQIISFVIMLGSLLLLAWRSSYSPVKPATES